MYNLNRPAVVHLCCLMYSLPGFLEVLESNWRLLAEVKILKIVENRKYGIECPSHKISRAWKSMLPADELLHEALVMLCHSTSYNHNVPRLKSTAAIFCYKGRTKMLFNYKV